MVVNLSFWEFLKASERDLRIDVTIVAIMAFPFVITAIGRWLWLG